MGSTENFVGRIFEGYDDGAVAIGVDTIRANQPGSPVHRPMMQTGVLLALMAAPLVAWFAAGGWVTLGVVLALPFVWFAFVRRYRDTIRDDVIRYLREQPHQICGLWNSGLISLTHVPTYSS